MNNKKTSTHFTKLLIMLSIISSQVATFKAWASNIDNNQPNVIFVLTDDQRYDELGFMNPVISTPNMDKMASEGVHFKNAFVTTALCSPSRASILTGQYMHNHGVVDNNAPPKEGTSFLLVIYKKQAITLHSLVNGIWVSLRGMVPKMRRNLDLITG